MQKQEEAVLLAAFRQMTKKDRIFLMVLAQSLKKKSDPEEKPVH